MSELTNKVLSILADARGEAVSGETIGRLLGVSRASVANYIAKLKEEGFLIESGTKSGHRLTELTDVLTSESLALFTSLPAKVVRQTESTFALASQEREACVVAALSQSGGRGRRRRAYSCEEGGAYFNIVCKPRIAPYAANLITLAAGIAVCGACKTYGVEMRLKYPNDGYVGDKKVCGILTECTMDVDEIRFASIGIGINVYNSIPPELREKAGKLSDYTAEKILRARLIGETAENLLELLACPEQIVRRYRRVDYLTGKRITLSDGNGNEPAEYAGIDEAGYLLAKRHGGIRRVTIGEVSVRPDREEIK